MLITFDENIPDYYGLIWVGMHIQFRENFHPGLVFLPALLFGM